MPFYREFKTDSLRTIRQWSGSKNSKYFIGVREHKNTMYYDTLEDAKLAIKYFWGECVFKSSMENLLTWYTKCIEGEASSIFYTQEEIKNLHSILSKLLEK